MSGEKYIPKRGRPKGSKNKARYAKLEPKYREVTDVAELICVNCANRWVGAFTREKLLKEIECPVCKKTGTVIKTGQSIMARLR